MMTKGLNQKLLKGAPVPLSEAEKPVTEMPGQGGVKQLRNIRNVVLAGLSAVLAAACGAEFSAAPGDGGTDAAAGSGGSAGKGGFGGGTNTGGTIHPGGTGGAAGHPEGGSGGSGGTQPGCNPDEPGTLTVMAESECLKALQTTSGGSVIIQSGSTPDNEACQTIPFCMKNIQSGDYGFLAVKKTADGCITVRHTAPIKTPGIYAWCVDNFSAPPGPTQTEMQGKLLSGGYTQVSANPADDPVTMCFACPQGDWVSYRIDFQ